VAGDARLALRTADGRTLAVGLLSYLDAGLTERAEEEANRWVKALRLTHVDGVPFRDRFTYRGDSLWWFAELYLHKGRAIVDLHRAILACERMVERERPVSIEWAGGDRIGRTVVPGVALQKGVPYHGPAPRARSAGAWRERAGIAVRSAFYVASAVAERLRPARRPPAGARRVAAFVHSAFWRAADAEETYIGPVLAEIAARRGDDQVSLVGLGPRTNFRQRRWQHRVTEFGDPQPRGIPLTPVQAFASWRSMRPSFALWLRRGAVARACLGSTDLRQASVIRGCDCWPVVRDELTGISHLQFPWSARAMDEAGAALDAIRPSAAITYAEAGGWGRALVLEARRRAVPSVGLQHGFIYRHWLNYRHEPDEMARSPANGADRGFPRPDLTVLYDRFAASYLEDAGSFPPSSLVVAGSPRLDAFVATVRALDDGDRARVRQDVGAAPGQHVVVVAAKFRQMGARFAALVNAVATMPGVRLVVKPHPAETAEPYRTAASGIADVAVAPPTADLASLIAVARALVTVNSTAAIEAMPLGVPTLVLGLPNNLSPFVDAGVMAGAASDEEIGAALGSLLTDDGYRARLFEAARAFMEQQGIIADGGSAGRAVTAIERLIPDP